MEFLKMFDEKMQEGLLANEDYQKLTAEVKAEDDVYCDLAMQWEFTVKVKEAYFDGIETIGTPEYEFSQKLYNWALKFVKEWPEKRKKLEAKAQKTHFKGRKKKIESDIEYYDKKFLYYSNAFEKRRKYQEHIQKHGRYNFEKAHARLSAIEMATAKKALAELSSTPEMAKFVEDRIMDGGHSTLSQGGKFDTLASKIVNDEYQKALKEEKREEHKSIVDKVLKNSKKVLNALEEKSVEEEPIEQ